LESDLSEVEYEEEELGSDDDFEPEDDRILRGNFVTKCAKVRYEKNWQRDPIPVRGGFQYQKDDTPMANFNSEKEAFEAIISPGIINL
jgi:hypothetical protein